MYKLKSFWRRNNLLLLLLTVFILGMAVMAVFDGLIRYRNHNNYKRLARISQMKESARDTIFVYIPIEKETLKAQRQAGEGKIR